MHVTGVCRCLFCRRTAYFECLLMYGVLYSVSTFSYFKKRLKAQQSHEFYQPLLSSFLAMHSDVTAATQRVEPVPLPANHVGSCCRRSREPLSAFVLHILHNHLYTGLILLIDLTLTLTLTTMQCQIYGVLLDQISRSISFISYQPGHIVLGTDSARVHPPLNKPYISSEPDA